MHDNTLDAYLARIRRKLREAGAPAAIETARGVGYRAAMSFRTRLLLTSLATLAVGLGALLVAGNVLLARARARRGVEPAARPAPRRRSRR